MAARAAGTLHKFTPEEIDLGKTRGAEAVGRMQAEGRGYKFTPADRLAGARKGGRAPKRKGPLPPWRGRRPGERRGSWPDEERRAELARLTLREIGERFAVSRQAVQGMLDRAEADKAR